MFTHPGEEEDYRRASLARKYPDIYNALVSQEQEERQSTTKHPDPLVLFFQNIKNFFRRKKA
mgnify:FL=1